LNGTAQTLAVQVRSRTAATGPGSRRRDGRDHDQARYDRMRDRRLAATLGAEDVAEDAGLDPFERLSCRIRLRWLHHCIHSAVHVVQVSGYRWCRSCQSHAVVAADELTGDIRVICSCCGQTPPGRASRQIIRTCTASIAAAQD
jgi:hypothetical protein